MQLCEAQAVGCCVADSCALHHGWMFAAAGPGAKPGFSGSRCSWLDHNNKLPHAQPASVFPKLLVIQEIKLEAQNHPPPSGACPLHFCTSK